MKPEIRTTLNRRERGQTIIVAMIILGLLLILGFVFIGIINRSINFTGVLQRRSAANDLSEAGIRYAHQQLLQSPLGADWRGLPTPLETGDFTRDPDAFFLRPPANEGGTAIRWPGSQAVDLGGPDGLGPFFRVPFQGGRALVRVRWAPSDPNIFRTNPTGPLRSPGAARNYIMIESVGREGAVNLNDPTTLSAQAPRKYRNYGSDTEFYQELGKFRADQARYGGIQVNRAFASIGIIESARFITNKYRVSAAADLGAASQLGAYYRDAAINDLPTQLGTSLPLLTFEGTNPSTQTGPVPIGGSLFSNADLRLHGRIMANLNLTLGDQIDVAGEISGDDDSSLQIFGRVYDPATSSYQPAPGYTGTGGNLTLLPGGSATFNSKSPNFISGGGALRDGSDDRDSVGGPRDVGRKEPPSILTVDPQTHLNRYLQMTRESGVLSAGLNTGQFGYGQGPYINNTSDRQAGSTETGRQNLGGQGSLINDWLNPVNREGGAWRGFYYTPPAAYVQFVSDGFVITRNSQAPQEERTWRLPNGADSGMASLRFRLGRGTDRRMHVVNQLEGVNINGTLSASDYDKGQPFNGVLYFEGNVRVRGTIPTDTQITLVSGATIYVEGSITKGVTGNDWTATYSTAIDGLGSTPQGTRLTRPTKSMLMLMARDYVAINTTQFFGPTPGEDVQPKEDVPNLPTFNPILVRTNGTLTLRNEFVLDPTGPNVSTPANPSQWRPFEADYYAAGNPTVKVPTNLLFAQAMDEGPGEATFLALDVNAGFASPSYQFPTGPNPPYANGATPYFSTATIPLYGLGTENYQRFGKFESVSFPLVDPNSINVDATTGNMTSTGSRGGYLLFAQSPNDFTLRQTSVGNVATNDYVLGRMALAPHDIRIEASMFAEEGSFFVIPGPWFNPNPNDTWQRWDRPDDAGGGTLTTDEKNARRMEEFGASPQMPFYGEPLDNRIVIVGAISENMPPTEGQQAEWLRKWGWIPRWSGANQDPIPGQHVPANTDPGAQYVPNIIVTYDPVLATGRRFGFSEPLNDPSTYVRSQWVDYNQDGVQQPTELVPLPPVPRLPVSPTLAYSGEVH